MIRNTTFFNMKNFKGPAYSSLGKAAKSAGSSRFIDQAIQSDNNLNGKHVTLNMGCLVSMAAGNGQELHMQYDESSTEENPVIRAWGKDSQGKAFEQKIYVNDIDPGNASPAEMKALQAHLSAQGNRAVSGHSSIPLDASMSGFDVNQKMDFTQYFEEWIGMQEIANKQNAASYRLELESYLFFCRQNNFASEAVHTEQDTKNTPSVDTQQSLYGKFEDIFGLLQ